MKTLHLVLKGKYFDMISSGEKKEEYRDITGCWLLRLGKGLTKESGFYISVCNFGPSIIKEMDFKNFDTVTFQHGYSTTARRMVVEFKGIDIGEPKPEWSDDHKGDVFRIKLGNIISKNF